MKQIDEEKLKSILEYIKTFQKETGRSPSFRQICHEMKLSTLSVAQRYVKVLNDRELISKSEDGTIKVPFNLQVGTTTIAPLVGTIACGSPIFAEENIEESFNLPTSIFGNGNLMMLKAKGDSMIGVGIKSGDLLVVECTNEAESGDIVVALINDSATVKTLVKTKDKVVLHPENPKYKDIEPKELMIQGIVKHVIHSFK